MLLTRAPVAGGGIAAAPLPLDLHVLGLSLAFILSQDQTLRCCMHSVFFSALCPAPPRKATRALRLFAPPLARRSRPWIAGPRKARMFACFFRI